RMPQEILMSEPTYIHFMIVDDHAVVRKGIAFSLLSSESIAVFAEAGSGEEALRLCTKAQPDVLLMDLELPGKGAIQAIHALCKAFPNVRVIALTGVEDRELVREALAAGGGAYPRKEAPPRGFVRGIPLGAHGLPPFEPPAQS